MKRLMHILSIAILFFTIRIFFAATIGSDSAPTRFNGQQVLQTGDRVAGFAWLAGGLLLADLSTTATFDSVFPVSGDFGLSFGNLILNQDLKLYNVTSISSWGSITGNFHVLELPAWFTCFPADIVADLCSVTLQSSITHGGQINSVAVSFDSAYVASGTVLTGGNGLFIDQIVSNKTLTNRASVAFATNVLAVAWHPTKYWLAVGIATTSFSTFFIYSFTPPTTTAVLSSISIGGMVGDSISSVAWHPSGLWVALGVNSGGAVDTIETYPINASTGAIGAMAGGDSTTNNTGLSVAWNTAGTFLAAGTSTGSGGTSPNELRVYSFNSNTGAITLATSVALGAQVNSVTWGQSPATANLIAVGVNFIAASPVNGYGLLLYKFTAPSTLTQLSSTVSGINVNSLSFSSTNSLSGESCLAAGLATNTTGPLQIYNVDTTMSYTLTIQDAQRGNGNALPTVQYSPNGNFLLTGDTAGNVSLYQSDAVFANTSIVYFSNLFLKCNSNTTWNSPAVAFRGQSVIDGRNWILSMASTFTLFVEPNSSLLIKNITLKGLASGQLVVDPSSTVSFQDVLIVLDGDYTFSTGHFEVLKTLEIAGSGHNFIYTSTQVSIINDSNPGTTSVTTTSANVCNPGFTGTVIFDPGVIFQYNSVNATNLIQLQGTNSQLIFNSATLILGNSLQLTKGSLIFSGSSFLQGPGSLFIGDGLSSANDLNVEVLPAANLLVTGELIYNNI